MEKVIAFLLALVMTVTLAACGVKEEKPAETPGVSEEATVAATEAEPFAVIDAKNCFYDAGFVELIPGAEDAATYAFAGEDSEAVEWSVYVLDESFEEGLRYIKQVAEPVLIGDGTITVAAGQYVYVYCSANEFTTDAADENAKLNVTLK